MLLVTHIRWNHVSREEINLFFIFFSEDITIRRAVAKKRERQRDRLREKEKEKRERERKRGKRHKRATDRTKTE